MYYKPFLFPLSFRLDGNGYGVGGALAASLLEVEKGLGFYHRHLVGIGGEGVYLQLASPSLEIYIAERLEAIDLKIGVLDKYAAIEGEAFKVKMTLAIQIRAHLLDLKISHIAYTPAEGAFVASRAAEIKSLNKAALRQHLRRRACYFGQAGIAAENAYDVSAARYPDVGLVLVGAKTSL